MTIYIYTMDSPIIFLVTGADHINNCNPIIKKARYIEYIIALHKIFYYSYPVIGVLSEVDKEYTEDRPPFESFPFQKLIHHYLPLIRPHHELSFHLS